MTTYKVVVDGSNIATEGRTLPSLTQLDEAVQAFIEEHPGADVLVIVDSSFPNRIDQQRISNFRSGLRSRRNHHPAGRNDRTRRLLHS